MSLIIGLFEKMGKLVGLDYEYEEENEETEEEIDAHEEEPKPVFLHENPDRSRLPSPVVPAKPPEKQRISIYEPKAYEDCKIIADEIMKKSSVIVNFNYTETGTARKVFYFLAGLVYALNGKYQKVANSIYLFVPGNIGVTNIDHPMPSLENTLSMDWGAMKRRLPL